jgi:hypothetical protein
MKNQFLCPHCESVLNPNVKITLAARYGRRRGMMLLSPQPGDYKFLADSSFAEALEPGAEVTFYCPVCSEDLTSPTSDRLVGLLLASPGQRRRRVEFSRTHGVHATFIVDEDSVTGYGEDAEEFGNVNFFGV